MSEKFNVGITIKAIDKLTAPIKRMTNQVEKFNDKVKANMKSAQALANSPVIEHMKTVGKRYAAFGGAIATGSLGLATVFTNTAAEFERFETILKTVEGSSEKARQSMKWVEDFATQTPYELSQVTDSFVKLKAYGLDPMQGGLLESLGNTASAMGKDVLQAVEAMADAVTGENERLKEFGIKARAEGNVFVYEYTVNGRQEFLEASKDDRAEIQRTLQLIMDKKYAGAMKDQMKTWNGMMSNLADHWTRFQNMVMKSGLFDWMKTKMQGWLDKINEMGNNGQLQKWAEDLAQKIQFGLESIWEFGKGTVAIFNQIKEKMAPIAEYLGGWHTLILGILALPIVATFATMAAAITTMASLAIGAFVKIGAGILMAFGPIGLIIAAVTALTAAFTAAYVYWDDLVAKYQKFKSWIGWGDDEKTSNIDKRPKMLSDVQKKQNEQRINNQNSTRNNVQNTNTFNFTARNADDIEKGVRRAMDGEYLGDLATGH